MIVMMLDLRDSHPPPQDKSAALANSADLGLVLKLCDWGELLNHYSRRVVTQTTNQPRHTQVWRARRIKTRWS